MKQHMILYPALALVIGIAPAAAAQGAQGAQQADTAQASRTHESLFSRRDAWLAAGFLGGTIALYSADRRIAIESQERDLQGNTTLRNVATDFRDLGGYGYLAGGVALYGVGRLAHLDRAAALGLHTTEAIVASGAVTWTLKVLAGRQRPYRGIGDPDDFTFGQGLHGGFTSFPSGHSTAAFAAASVITAEMKAWWPHSVWYVAPLAYGSATAVALSRIYNDAHWSSDVLMGAGIGTLTGLTVVRWNHLHPKNPIDRVLLSTSVAPAPGGGVVVGWRVATP